MERLYTPWRMKYITTDKKSFDGCVFCVKLKDDFEFDRENYLVYRGRYTFTVMNIYPYNIGHLMILPRDHVATLAEVPPQTQCEMMALTTYFTGLLSELMRPDGFNIGINLGQAAGAGLASHLHMHIVPRWQGDSNFMAVVGETRVIPEELSDTYDRLVKRLREKPPTLPPS